MFQGKTAADVTFTGATPWFASFQSGAFRADLLARIPQKSADKFCDLSLSAEQIRTKPLDLFKEAKSAVDLTQAPLIVAIGRGIKAPKIFRKPKRSQKPWAAKSPRRARFAMKAGSPWSGKSAALGQTVAPKTLFGPWHQWRDPTCRRNERCAHYRRHQQGFERSHFRNRGIRCRRRHLRNSCPPSPKPRKSEDLVISVNTH